MKNRQTGISLVEIMVALTAGLLLMGAVIQLFVNNKATYRALEANARVQENARFAAELLRRDIRMAGFQGCMRDVQRKTVTLNDASSFVYDFSTPLQGFEATESGWSPALDSAITAPLAGRDILAVRTVTDEGVAIVGQPSNSGDCTNSASHTANLKVSDSSGFQAGDIVIAGNCEAVTIFQITNVNTGHLIVHNTGNAVSPGNKTTDLGACYAGNGNLFHYNTVTFYVRNNPYGEPALYRKAGNSATEELVEGVEDMQVRYGEDSDGDGYANRYVPANEITDWNRVVTVRIQLLLRSLEDNVTTAPQLVVFNGATLIPNDRRLRRAITLTIALRNQLP